MHAARGFFCNQTHSKFAGVMIALECFDAGLKATYFVDNRMIIIIPLNVMEVK
jgi:hypothetical protein